MVYDIMQVCLDGHQINDSYNQYPEYNKKFCDECGAKTTTHCLKCLAPIKGAHIGSGVIAEIPVPNRCDNCGNPYPWSIKKEMNKTNEVINKQMEELKRMLEEKKMFFDPVKTVEYICNRFHIIAGQLKKRYNNRPPLEIKDEYDVQDLLHALLKLHFNDIRPEERTPSYAGGSSIMDFLMKKEKIVVETKKTREGLGAKEIGEQLLIDIAKYSKHPDCKTLICFVYDPDDIISNPSAIENDLSKQTNDMYVKVLIYPKKY